MHPAVLLRYPFLTLEQAAYFLGIPAEEAKRRYEADELPKALRADGGLFEPTPGLTLIPYLEFVRQVDARVRAELEGWQGGKFKLPAKPRLTLTTTVTATAEASEA